MKRKVLALVGWKNSGKTYLAKYFETHYGFKIMNFSDPLKKMISEFFEIDRKILDGDDEKYRKLKEEPDSYWTNLLGMEVSPRTIMTGIGMGLRSWCPHIWVALMKHNLDKLDEKTHVIIPDLRMINEYEMLADNYDLTMVWVLREEKPWLKTGILAASGDTDAINWMNKNNIHITEYEWLKFIEKCDFIYKNDKQGIKEDSIKEILKIYGYEHG